MNNDKTNKVPWYDGHWLNSYYKAIEVLRMEYPDKLRDFVEAMSVFRTDYNFNTKKIPQVFDVEMIGMIKHRIETLKSEKPEKHELFSFGRLVVHDDPFFTLLQNKLIKLVSEQVEEEVEAHYNFLSLYTNLGVCPIHLDSPEAKWTLDICIDQSFEWPIYLSQVIPWPEHNIEYDQNWQEEIKSNKDYRFKSYTLTPGEGIIFGGSSQYHYREGIYQSGRNEFCNLLFFHFIPKGTKRLVDPRNWSEIFGIPELK